MKLSNNKMLSTIVLLVILVVYSVVVFMIPFVRGAMFWTGYGFSTMAILLTAVVCYQMAEREGLKSKFYGIPPVLVAWRYLIAQMIVGLAEMLLFMVPFQFGIAANVIMLGICIIGLLTIEIATGEIERIDEKVKEKVFYIKSLQGDVETLADKTNDESVGKNLRELVETIRYSDPMSSPQLAAVENKIETKTVMLTKSIEEADYETAKALCAELQQLFAERNRKCKALK